MEENKKSRVERLKERLYSNTRYRAPEDSRRPVGALESPEVEAKWQTPELDEMLKHERIVSAPNPFLKKFFIFSIVFFVATLGVAAYIIMGGANFVSSKNVDITVLGPTSVSAGEKLDLGVVVTNANNADLEVVNLIIQYPQGARDSEDTSRTLTYAKEEIGSIRSGDEVVRDLSMVLIGSIGEVREIKLSVEYTVKGSNATFQKEKVYEITIGEAPISLSIERPTNVTSGETFTTLVSVTLNSTEVLKGVMLKVEYPYGYAAVDSSPAALPEGNIWSLGDLSPGDKKTISIRGSMVGENLDERTFRFYVGVSDSGNASNAFNNLLVSTQESITVARPSIGLNVSFSGSNVPVYIAPAGQTITTSVRLQNNMTDKILNPRLEVRFSGEVLDRFSVNAQSDGFYDSQTNNIKWDISNNANLPEFLPGQSNQVSFSFASLSDPSVLSGSREIQLEFILTGTPQGADQFQPISIRESRTVRIASQVSLNAKSARTLGPFINTGPIPPKVGEATTYTAIFEVGNTQNDGRGTKLVATLGPGVTWVEASDEDNEKVTYNSVTNTVTWDMGTLSSGSGFSSAKRTAAVKLSLTPSTSQIGTSPTLLSGIVLSGVDSFTNQSFSVSHQPLTTAFTTDPAYIQGDDRVVN